MSWTFNPFTGKLDAQKNLSEAIAHADLSDMDATVHDGRYYTETEIDAKIQELKQYALLAGA